MLSLTKAAQLTKKLAFTLVVFLVAVIFLVFIFKIGVGIWQQLNPPPPTPPSVEFGRLPALDFSGGPAANSGEISYQLETIEGGLPKLPDQALVFKVIPSQPSILFGEKVRAMAARLGFEGQPTVTSEQVYQFENSLGQALTINVLTGHFSIDFDFSKFFEPPERPRFRNEQEAVKIAKGFLAENNLKAVDLADEKIKINFLKVESGQIIAAKSLSEAALARVDFYRANLADLPIIPQASNSSLVWVLTAPGKQFQKDTAEANYSYWAVNTKSSATYPLKTATQAYEELVTGNGLVIGEKKPQAVIRRVYLAYLETPAQMSFLQPVVVFDGDNNFRAVVPAVSSAWIEGQAEF